MSKNGKILVAMSGGVDSSVAAMLLHEQGYDVIGITMKVWDYASFGGTTKETGCCSLDSINDARYLAVQLGFPHYILDLREDFEKHVISNFISEYKNARTPNPCVLCNTHIKWEALLRKADMLDCEFIATGHYAFINQLQDRFYISKGNDEIKDQSYVLWGLTQQSLSRTMFPLNIYSKTEIKEMALNSGYDAIAKKSESYEICFIPDNDYRGFLKRRVDDFDAQFPEGNFVDKNGKILGKHKGLPFYTIGQRKGLDIAMGVPYYVVDIKKSTNEVVLGEKEALYSDSTELIGVNLHKYAEITDGMDVLVKVRYKDPGTAAKLFNKNGGIEVVFNNPVSAITPGQSAVFYEGKDIIGGGFIR
ncbi:MAG: tRNA 2-thiouridine(34) synthase MnmA [Bacteroidota bacterium]